ncbi:MAG: tetratricopeptide repeat protein [Nitrospirae bacterium]|nr:tetratricopeptide repeat protein [Nitrospirota bacterium]
MLYNGISMDDASGSEGLLKKGIALLGANNPLGALACFEKAYAINKTADIQSYLGLCIATERGRISEAVRLCSEAIDREPGNPLHYLNLGKVYLKADRKTDCLEALRRGLSYGDSPEIYELLERIGMRKPPVLSFLPRNNFLNRYIGLIATRLRLRNY